MIKRTLYFGNPAYLSFRNGQLVVRLPEVEKNEEIPESFKKEARATIPVEDIGIVILDHPQLVITHALLSELEENTVAVLVCNQTHHPAGMLMPLNGNTVQSERFKCQLDASEPLKKQLWAQTVSCKIRNQHVVLGRQGVDNNYLVPLFNHVRSGDGNNCEATAASYYWNHFFDKLPSVFHPGKPLFYFKRHREGDPPNQYFNYGYAILRATMARSIVGAGLLPTLGIHHRNRYNAFCLADDLMEPYRPFVDQVVYDTIMKYGIKEDLPIDVKKELLGIPALDVIIEDEKSPLMVATQRTAVSLYKCFAGEYRKISYPEIP